VIVDGHLDIAANALMNVRDLTLPVGEIRAREPARRRSIAMTSLPSLAAAGVGVVFATLFAEPAASWAGDWDEIAEVVAPLPCYTEPAEAEAAALVMLDLYERWAEEGQIRLITSVVTLDDHLRRFAEDPVPGLVLTLEGADPLVTPDHLERFVRRGLRVIGLAWGTTRYAGGSGSSDGVTPLGRELLQAMAEQRVIHDAAHLSEEAFWEAVALPCRALCASHGTARRLMTRPGPFNGVPYNRYLSDDQIAEVARPHGAASRGVIGLALLNDFLEARWNLLQPERGPVVSVDDQVARHFAHIARIAGWESVGLGTDIDAGYGRDETPAGVDTCADWPRLADVVPDHARAGVLGDNWLRFLREALPETD
jgi:membrane dipeptidase